MSVTVSENRISRDVSRLRTPAKSGIFEKRRLQAVNRSKDIGNMVDSSQATAGSPIGDNFRENISSIDASNRKVISSSKVACNSRFASSNMVMPV
jgi:hypothetical protein